jgi:hypothetical protein
MPMALFHGVMIEPVSTPSSDDATIRAIIYFTVASVVLDGILLTVAYKTKRHLPSFRRQMPFSADNAEVRSAP